MSDDQKVHPMVGQAVEAFREAERVRLLLDKKEAQVTSYALHIATDPTVTPEDMARYVQLTQEIIDEYDVKREKAGL